MFYHVQSLINPIVADEPDPSAANALQEGLGGQFGEMRTMMQYLFQSFNFRGDGIPYLDLIQGIFTSLAVFAIAAKVSLVRPGCSFRKSYPAFFCCLTISAAASAVFTLCPLKEGPEVIKRGPRISPLCILLRNSRCRG